MPTCQTCGLKIVSHKLAVASDVFLFEKFLFEDNTILHFTFLYSNIEFYKAIRIKVALINNSIRSHLSQEALKYNRLYSGCLLWGEKAGRDDKSKKLMNRG